MSRKAKKPILGLAALIKCYKLTIRRLERRLGIKPTPSIDLERQLRRLMLPSVFVSYSSKEDAEGFNVTLKSILMRK